jgi:hypothetical protein
MSDKVIEELESLLLFFDGDSESQWHIETINAAIATIRAMKLSISPEERDGLQAIDDGLRRHGNGFVVIPGSDSYRAVRSILERHATARPPSQGWLTGDEREHLAKCRGLAEHARKEWERLGWTRDQAEAAQTVRIIDGILARNAPPQIKPIPLARVIGGVRYLREDTVMEHLAAAGIPIDEKDLS